MKFIRNSIIFSCLLAIVISSNIRQENNDKKELEDYIQKKKAEVNNRYKLHYHITPPVGWLNDPNGFSYYKGEYHLFYQFYPYATVWGPMHWGHVSSPDMVHWKQLPTALLPEDEQIFSGSAVVDGDDLVLIYTGHVVSDKDPYFNESQYLAYSKDGVNFDKYIGNPVLPAAPNGSPDFRDPKVWKHGEYWYAVLGSKTDDKKGQVLLYRTRDLKRWDYLSVIGESDGNLGYMWECPDFFELDGKFVLLMSPQGMQPQGDRYKNRYQTGYIIGNFSYETFQFTPESEFQEIDFGHDFYATQTIQVNDRRLLVAWFSMWEQPHPEDVDGWVGALTIIRELSLVGDRVIMKPVDEMLTIRENVINQKKLEQGKEIIFGKAAEIIVKGDLAKQIKLAIEGTEGGGKAWLAWDPESGKVSVDRGAGDIRQVEWSPHGRKSWRIFLDASSVEMFCGEGEVVFSSRVYPDGGWKVTNIGNQSLDIEAYPLKRSINHSNGLYSNKIIHIISSIILMLAKFY